MLLVALLVFASGCAALVFQVAWMRELRLVFGATTAAVSAVLAIFMGGLGVGSAVLGKRADRVANPLRFYGLLEIAIALSVAVTPWLVSLTSMVYIGLGGQESLGLQGATAARLLLALLIMAVPTFLMGGTLPAAVRAVTSVTDRHRGALGVLYGANTLGAVFGTAVTTFFALEYLGTRATLWTGCALGLSAGAIAVGRSRRLPAEESAIRNQESGESPAALDPDTRPLTPSPGVIYLTAAVLGFTFFALELVWYRMLAPILGGTTFTFGLILCVALLGIGVGGIAYNVVFRRLRPSWAALAVTCGCEAALVIVPFALGDRLALLAASRAASATSFAELVTGWCLVAGIVILPVALVSGLQFPLLTALLGQGRRTVSRHLGTTYAWNTAGAITGSLVAGFGGLPLLSAPGLWRAISGLLAILSVGVLVAAPRRGRRATIAVAGLIMVTIGSMFAAGPTTAWRHGGIGAGRAELTLTSPNLVRQWLNEKRRTVIWEADGIESSIGIDAPNGLSFIVNGKNDGNSITDAATQIGVAVLGAVLHPDPKTGLVIGLGTGESAGWLAEMRDVERVDVVELEPAIDEMAHRCRELNWHVLNHPRVRRIYNDGREFVLTTDDKYDLILSEPSNPYRAGIASLYTQEFYRSAKACLNPEGLFIQWLQAYEVDELTVATVLATARSVFEHVEIWQTLATDLQLVCSSEPLRYSTDELQNRVQTETVQLALNTTWHVNDLEGFLSHFAIGSQWADSLLQQPLVPRNTDDRTVLEYRFAKTVGRRSPLSMEEARASLAEGWRRPALEGGDVDWNEVEQRRQEMNLTLGGQLSIALLPRAEDRKVVEAFEQYRASDFSGVVQTWPESHLPPSTDVERLVLARCFAELAQRECLDLIAEVQGRHSIEAAALRAIYHWRADDPAQAEQALVTYFGLLAESTWKMSIFDETAFSRAIDVARADPLAARRFFDLLAKPFATYRYDQQRQLARLVVAQELGPDSVVEALEPLEPHVPWTADILQMRAEAYAATDHPLAARAARDWQWFQRHE